jgi:hypothetical protein
MGIFDKKKGKRPDEFDSPVEQIDLSAQPEPKPQAEATAEASSGSVTEAAPEDEPEEQVARPPASDYGIEEAIALMRTLPDDNVELVVQVVKHTLESTNINIKEIIDDASDKQTRIDQRIKVLKEEIADLENEIATRSKEITSLEEDHKETSQVKERLQLAEKLGKSEKPKGKVTAGIGSARQKSPTSIPPIGSSSKPKTTVVAKK